MKKTMSGKDYLSQEEIDALLRQTMDDTSGAAGPNDEVNHYLTSMEQDALGEIGNITFGSAATALSQLLGKKVEITTPKVSIVAHNKLEAEFPRPHVAVHVKFIEGFHGINLLVIKTKDARVIADLMMGGIGNVEDDGELTEIHISAVQEAMNQMMGASATSMSTIFNRFVNISPPGINILDLARGEGADQIPAEDVLVKISFRLTIGDLIDSTIMQLLTVPFAKEMVATLMGGTESAPAVEAPPSESSSSRQPQAASPTHQEPSGEAYHGAEPQMPPYDPYVQQSYAQPYAQPAAGYQQPQPMHHAAQPSHYGAAPNRSVNVQPAQFAPFVPQQVHADDTNLNLLLDIPLKVTVELGRTQKLIKDILELSQGSIIELDKLAGEPVDILVNNKLIAKGEVVVIDENFGVRVTDIVSQQDRMQKLR
jgi:flagellar motor switch protein FliN/FliY